MTCLSKEDLFELTGSKHISKQKAILEQHGIYYINKWDGTITTTWEHVNNPSSQSARNDEEPDFDQIA